MRMWKLVAAAACLTIFGATTVVAQQVPRTRTGQPGMNRPTGGQPGRGNVNRTDDAKEEFKLPDDPKLLKIHETFVLAAMKLAQDYENAKDIEKAATCYEEILRLVPTYAQAEQKLKEIKVKEAIADRKPFEVYANRAWQDTGVTVLAGKPLTIRATGSWSLKMSYQLSADGIEIPKELQELPLGALVGVIAEPNASMDEAKPFFIGASKSFEPNQTGRLLLRIYDQDVDDNVGKLSVLIEGTFKK